MLSSFISAVPWFYTHLVVFDLCFNLSEERFTRHELSHLLLWLLVPKLTELLEAVKNLQSKWK